MHAIVADFKHGKMESCTQVSFPSRSEQTTHNVLKAHILVYCPPGRPVLAFSADMFS